jgi:hypothetical protein
MSKPSQPKPFSGAKPRAETALDKTTRAANEIIEEQNATMDRKTAQLREARLERDAQAKRDADATKPKAARKPASAKSSGKA